ncbi:hypothetical protein [Aquimarina sp. SS2-1]|uniref:hypothetical protein n=1 Tax=Aquimarina besae TaxID=3342247 RepID=UPI0036720D93
MNLKLASILRTKYKTAFIVLSLLLVFLMPILSFDYGIIEDAKVHQEHGERILDYFKGKDNSAALSPLDEHGNLLDISIDEQNKVRGMNGFGGFFDLVANFLYQYQPITGVYEFRNFLSALFGVLLFFFCGLLGKELGGWKTGFFALVFALLSPLLFGQSMYNPKDIPFATFYIICVYHLVKLLKELPEVTLKRSLCLIINISILINIRLFGLVFIGQIMVAVFFWWLVKNYQNKLTKSVIKKSLLLFLKITLIGLLGYLGTGILWPYLQTNPFTGLVELFIAAKDFKGFEAIQLFEGEWKSSFEMPWYYPIKYLLYLQLPLHLFLGVFLIPVIYYKTEKFKTLQYSVVLFTGLFPLFLILVGKPNYYDNARQFLFLTPPLIVMISLAYNKLIILQNNKMGRRVVYILLLFLLLQPLKFLMTNHPVHSLYYNPIIGGIQGAFGKYEIDYWGVAVKPAVEWLKNNAESDDKKPVRVRLYYGDQLKASYFLGKTSNLNHVIAPEKSSYWDYSIVLLSEAKYNKSLLRNWPPENSVYSINVDEVPVCAIVKNNFKPDGIKKLQEQLKQKPDSKGFIQLGLLYYNKEDYVNCIKASKKAIDLNPNSSIAYNNICSSYNALSMFERAAKSCEKALELNPDFQLAKNNLKFSEDSILQLDDKPLSVDQYIALSLKYYQLGDYDDCIRISEELLKIDKDNAVAYNNICSAYNALKKYHDAINACKNALELSPDFQLAKNNLRWSKEQLTKEGF